MRDDLAQPLMDLGSGLAGSSLPVPPGPDFPSGPPHPFIFMGSFYILLNAAGTRRTRGDRNREMFRLSPISALGQDFSYHLPGYVGQAEVAAGVAVG